MNIRAVLRTYAMLRVLTDDETALLETLRGLSDSEHEAMVQALAPQKATVKRKRPSKSAKALSLASAIKGKSGDVTVGLTGVEAKASAGSVGIQVEEDGILSTTGDRCTTTRDDGKPCGLLPDHNVHHLESAVGYHGFESAVKATEQADAAAGD
jgi:hypothetical protein